MNIEFLQDALDYGVIGILGFMSFITLWFWIERLMFFRTVDLGTYRLKEALEIDLTNNISVISSFGSNAPYIGLLGTVFGIIITFYVMGQSGDLDAKTIMTSLALALKATAMGLAVAIPAIFFHTHIVRKMDVLIAKWEIIQKEKVTIKRFDSINIVPFIDIMLVLLVIVLTTATFVAKGIIPVELPSAKSALKQDIPSVTITIKESGEMFFEESRADLKEIAARMTEYDLKTPININCDKATRFDLFVGLVDTLKQKNYNNIGIVTQKEDNGAGI